MDEYIPKKSKVIGYTFRIVFQAEDRTLTDKEVNKIMEKIVAELKRKFKVEIR
jgi:phenylalanyl-tRNA synthetase beta subunit